MTDFKIFAPPYITFASRKNPNAYEIELSIRLNNMTEIQELSVLIAKYFGSDAHFYVKQHADGSYRKTPGKVNPILIETVIKNRQSVGCYQRNVDHTLNWICFDFDVLKINIGTEDQEDCEISLLASVREFIVYLDTKNIAYILEYSGNRGIHVWINFLYPIFPSAAFEIVKYLLDQSEVFIDRKKIGLDLFPSSATHKSSFGKAVKTPLSLHAKSGAYSVLLRQLPVHLSDVKRASYDSEFIHDQLEILKNHTYESLDSIEQKLDFEFKHDALDEDIDRVRAIIVSTKSICVSELISHWESIPVMSSMLSNIRQKEMGHARRQLLVGLFIRVLDANGELVGRKLLIEMLSSMANYDAQKTADALDKLRFLHFPNQETIEALCNHKFASQLNLIDLVKMLIPNFIRVDDGLFQVSETDIKVTRFSERNYLYQNDEVKCMSVVDELTTYDSQNLTQEFEEYINNLGTVEFYRHKRKEKNKQQFRELISLSASSRLFSSWAIKHLSYLYDGEVSANSFGYKVNRNFIAGHIFKPWLYQWIEFLKNISDFLNNELNSGYFLVKTDIKNFYDSIPHDSLERLLLTGFNSKISNRITQLQDESIERHRKIIIALNRITKACNPNRIGLPQGPAYARVFAELYLSQIDELMDNYLGVGDILFYHRYVDDIFFVAEDNDTAIEKISQLRERLALLGLSLNEEKTSITRVGNFGSEFDKYRAQSKYAIDAISKNFDDASNHEKNVALLEYNKLIAQQDENDDAVFLFSHLPGVSLADDYRNRLVTTIIKNGVGRGNLFKHVFIYLLNTPVLWTEFEDVTVFTELQSEVFTSVCLEILSDQPEADSNFLEFICKQLKKIQRTPIVCEHLAYLKLYFQIGEDYLFSAADILKCIHIAENPDRLIITQEIVDFVSSVLNEVDDIGDFVKSLYPMSILARTDSVSVNALAQIFIAKLASDEKTQKLSFNNCGERIKSKIRTSQFYQLLCLFTLSKANTSTPLLERSWEFCSQLFNQFENQIDGSRRMLWCRNFHLLDINRTQLNFVVTSIAEEAIWRGGASDTYGIYMHYHNALMVWLLKGEVSEIAPDLKESIKQIAEISCFYKWLFSENVNLFPSRSWFIENLIRNDCIILEKENQVLIRKRIDNFRSTDVSPDTTTSTLNGYGNLIIEYDFNKHLSVFDHILLNNTFFSKLKSISSLIGKYSDHKDNLPNIFSRKNLLTINELLPFSDEIRGHEYLIFESVALANSLENDFVNFIRSVFSIASQDSSCPYSSGGNTLTLWDFYSKYVKNIENINEVPHFLNNFIFLCNIDNHQIIDEVNFDLATAGALYTLSNDFEMAQPFARVRKFFDSYNKIHRDAALKHIYMVDPQDIIKKDNLRIFLDGLLIPLNRAGEYRPDLGMNLSNDIEEYAAKILEMVSEISSEISLKELLITRTSQSLITGKIIVNDIPFDYEDIVIINPMTGLNESFSSNHVYLMQSSEDIFGLATSGKMYLFFAPKEFTKCFSDVLQRCKYYFSALSTAKYPYIESEDSIRNININAAANVVAVHRCIPEVEARARLIAWLRHIPERFRLNMVLLIESHVYMLPSEVCNLKANFNSLLETGKNPFLIKRFRDFGGIHRILSTDDSLARLLDDCGPDSIKSGAKEASLFADVGLSGSQLTAALDYYLSTDSKEVKSIYFSNSNDERLLISKKLHQLECINFCFVLYTSQCEAAIRSVLLKHNLNPVINFVGRNISDSAFLKSTSKISAKDKRSIDEFLKDKDAVNFLAKNIFHMNSRKKSNFIKKLSSDKDINLVCRVKSMPKMALDFFTCDFKGQPDSALFERFAEIDE